MIKYSFLFLAVVLIMACNSPKHLAQRPVVFHTNQQVFWNALHQLCGNAYEGTIVSAPANDTLFKNKSLIMHVRACNDGRIRIPFVVGNDLSRTWVFTKDAGGLMLKHDHRHRDGSADSITMYGGHTTNSGTAAMQFFPADQQTTNMLPAAGGNVWWVEMLPGKYFTYNLRRMGSDRLFSIRFDISKTIAAPVAPWGWKDE
ncbi:MAG: hypothetical protein WBO39_02230 [Ferruginibacter sp.]